MGLLETLFENRTVVKEAYTHARCCSGGCDTTRLRETELFDKTKDFFSDDSSLNASATVAALFENATVVQAAYKQLGCCKGPCNTTRLSETDLFDVADTFFSI